MIGVRNQIDIFIAIFEHATVKNRDLGPAAAGHQLPLLAGLEVGFDTEGGAPIQIALWVAPISKRRRNQNDALMLIVRQGDKDVYNPGRSLPRAGTCKREKTKNRESGQARNDVVQVQRESSC